jgi:DNA-binding transcriptional MocR family regulator
LDRASRARGKDASGKARRPGHPERRPVVAGPLALSLERDGKASPLFRQIQHGIRSAILEGALVNGDRLQPERVLALSLGVNRTTIMRAYQELVDEGLVEARPGRGTVVAVGSRSERASIGPSAGGDLPGWLFSLPEFGDGHLGPDPSLLRDIAEAYGRDDLVSMALGAPGPDLIPANALRAACSDVLERFQGNALGYGPVEGLVSLRRQIAAYLCGRGVRVEPSEVVVLSGATQGLSLAARTLVQPGDEVVVEVPTYVGILQTFAAAGARLVGVPVDRHGLRVEEVAAVLARGRARLIVVQPTLHNPTNSTLTHERRLHLLALARRYSVPILEDDAYGDLWRDSTGPQPLKALDTHGYVIYLGTFSKMVAPALRLGWVAAPRAYIGRLTLAKQFADLQSGMLAQYAMEGFMANGAFSRHLISVRQAYNERRRAAVACMQELRGVTTESGSDGGFYLWCRLPEGVPSRAFSLEAGRAGVAILAGEAFYPQATASTNLGVRYVRLSYSALPPSQIRTAVRRLAPLLAARQAGPPERQLPDARAVI